MTTKKDHTTKVMNPGALSILDGIFKSPGNEDNETVTEEVTSKTASVKFMITLQEVHGLRDLGYSQAQIDKMKPEEAADLIKSGTQAVPSPTTSQGSQTTPE